VLPGMWCYCDQDQDAEVLQNCTSLGTDMELPFQCASLPCRLFIMRTAPSLPCPLADRISVDLGVTRSCHTKLALSEMRMNEMHSLPSLVVDDHVCAAPNAAEMCCRCPVDHMIIMSKLEKSGASLRHPGFLRQSEVHMTMRCESHDHACAGAGACVSCEIFDAPCQR